MFVLIVPFNLLQTSALEPFLAQHHFQSERIASTKSKSQNYLRPSCLISFIWVWCSLVYKSYTQHADGFLAVESVASKYQSGDHQVQICILVGYCSFFMLRNHWEIHNMNTILGPVSIWEYYLQVLVANVVYHESSRVIWPHSDTYPYVQLTPGFSFPRIKINDKLHKITKLNSCDKNKHFEISCMEREEILHQNSTNLLQSLFIIVPLDKFCALL